MLQNVFSGCVELLLSQRGLDGTGRPALLQQSVEEQLDVRSAFLAGGLAPVAGQLRQRVPLVELLHLGGKRSR